MKWFFLMLASVVGWILALFVVPVQIGYRIFSRKYDLAYYFHQIAVGNDKMIGSMVYGSKHTISAITGYKAYQHNRWHVGQEYVIDFLFGKGHCYFAAKDEGLI